MRNRREFVKDVGKAAAGAVVAIVGPVAGSEERGKRGGAGVISEIMA